MSNETVKKFIGDVVTRPGYNGCAADVYSFPAYAANADEAHELLTAMYVRGLAHLGEIETGKIRVTVENVRRVCFNDGQMDWE